MRDLREHECYDTKCVGMSYVFTGLNYTRKDYG